MTGIKTLAVAGLLLAMMFSPSLSYPSFEGESGAMMKLEGIYCVINLVHAYISQVFLILKVILMSKEHRKINLPLLNVSANAGVYSMVAFHNVTKNMCIDHISRCIVSICFPFLDICADSIYVIAFTTHHTGARTTDNPFLSLTLTNGAEREERFYNNAGNGAKEYYWGIGDLWEFPISDFGFSGSTCVTYDSVSRVAIRAGGSDNWSVNIVITVLDIDGVSQPLTLDFPRPNRWIDTDVSSQREFVLTKV